MDDLVLFEQGTEDETIDRTVRPMREGSSEALARLALEEALTAAQLRRISRPRSFVMVVEVPGEDWVQPIKEACENLRGWDATFARNGSARQEHVPSRGNDVVAKALDRDGAVLGVSQNPSNYLPSALAAADIRVKISPPGNGLVVQAIRTVTGRGPSAMPDRAAAGLSYWELAACIRGTPKASVDRIAAAARAKSVVDASVASAPSFETLVGYGAAHEWGTRLLQDLGAWRRGETPFDLIDRFAVLASEPGLGKSTYVRSLAKAAALPLIITSVSSWFTSSSGYLDGVLKQIDNIFEQAANYSPSIIYLDEIDSIPDRNSMDERSRSWWTPVCTHILLRIDQLVTDPNIRVCMIGATNHAARLDPALIRPGRLTRVITIDRPTAVELAAIARQHLGNDLPGIDLTVLGELGQGATGAQVAGWVREARSHARAAGRPITLADMTDMIAPADTRSSDMLWRCALHESAHAVVTEVVGTGRLLQVDIVARGGDGGGTAVRSLLPLTPVRSDLERLVVALLSGRAAEVAFLGEACAGAGGGPDSDLGRATTVIANIHGNMGLGPGLVYRGTGTELARQIREDAALRAMVEGDLHRLQGTAERFVLRHRYVIELLAERLIKDRVVAGDVVRSLLSETVRQEAR